MLELTGQYNSCKIFTDTIDSTTISQIINILNQPQFKDSKIRIMPDAHAGKGCVIGTTMTFSDKIVPNLVGCDIACGVLYVKLKETEIDLPMLDAVIKQYVPNGASLHDRDLTHPEDKRVLENLKNLRAGISMNRITRSLGTLGGGNHFISLEKDDKFIYLVIHTGSRHLGKALCDYYQNKAVLYCSHKGVWTPEDLTYLSGKDMDDYLHDSQIAAEFAKQNRRSIARTIMEHMDLHMFNINETVHNYVDYDAKIIRKGAVRATYGEELIIPINMRDGSLICTGFGQPDWNFSAPHGAGRILSRSEAKSKISLDEYKKSMQGIYSSCIKSSTLDESPNAYKSIDEIMKNIAPSVNVKTHIKPIYNFKAS